MKKNIYFSFFISLFIFHFSFSGFAQYQYTDLHNFTKSQGVHPYGSLTKGGKMLYGMTNWGGTHNGGSIYALDTNGNNFKDLIDFNYSNSPQGGYAYGALLLVGNKLFGMTWTGGTNYAGCLFSVDTDGTNYKDLINFDGDNSPNGDEPYGSLIISGTTLYGMTYEGGAGYGCIFSLDTDGSGYTDLHNFTGTTGGEGPYGSLVISGNELFGMASGGGTNGDGLIFSMHTDGSAFNVLLNISVVNGASPLGSLILSGNMLYGMTYQGGFYRGNIFCVDTNGNHHKDLHDFGVVEPNYPLYTQLSILGGTLYGMTGGFVNLGCIFSMDTNGSAFNVMYNFTGTTGAGPVGALLLSGNRIYGTTGNGGTADSGVVFSFRQCSLNASVIIDSNASCNGNSNGSVTLTASAGITPYTYSWTSNPVQTNAQATGLSAGTYTVTVYDSTGCTAKLSVTITQPSKIVADTMLSTCATCCNCHGTATDSVYGGTAPYTYLWSNGRTTDTILNLSSGSYTCTVTDAHGCVHTDTTFVTQGMHTTTSQSNITCNGDNNGSASAIGDGNNTYLWSPGRQTTSSISGLSPGTYVVTIGNLDTAGCIATITFVITQPPPFTTSVSLNSNVKCYGETDGSATANASGGIAPYNYSWSDGEHSATATSLPAGLASVTVTDKNGCTASGSITITQPASALAITVSTYQANCSANVGFGANVSGGTPPYNYSWPIYGNNNYIDINLSCPNRLLSPSSLTVTDANGCSAWSYLYFNVPVQMYYYTQTNVTCYGGSNGTITTNLCGGGFGPLSYTISPGGTYSSGNQPYVYTNLTAGTYTISVEDGNGCNTGPYIVTITQPPAIIVTTNVTAASCSSGGSATASVTSGGVSPFTYSWLPSGGTNAIASNLSAGTYTITVTDNKGCTGSASAVIVGSALNVNTTVTSNIPCYGGSNGSASCTVSGGTSPYTYSWNVGGSNSIISNLSAGSYTLSVTDTNNCLGLATVTITQPNQLSVTGIQTSNISCYGGTSGSASATASGGTLPYTYSWNVGGSNSTVSNLSAGTYTITVQDNCGASATDAIVVTQPNILAVNLTVTANVNCHGDSTGIITSSRSGGTPGFSYSWRPPVTTFYYNTDAIDLTAGTYTLSVTDINGCTGSASATITQPNQLSVSAYTITNVSCNNGTNGSAGSTISGGTKPFTYLWTGGGTTSAISNLSIGTYTITVHDSCDNSATAATTITQPALLTISGDSINDNGSCNGSAWISVGGGTNPYIYLWTGGNTTDSIFNQCSGNYCCVVTDANGCLDSVCVTINLSTSVNQLGVGNSQITIYPNPNNGEFTLQIDNEQLIMNNEKTNIEIYNILGQQIFQKLSIVNYPLSINLSDKANGVYFYRIINNNGGLLSQGKLVIQR